MQVLTKFENEPQMSTSRAHSDAVASRDRPQRPPSHTAVCRDTHLPMPYPHACCTHHTHHTQQCAVPVNCPRASLTLGKQRQSQGIAEVTQGTTYSSKTRNASVGNGTLKFHCGNGWDVNTQLQESYIGDMIGKENTSILG